MNIRNNKINGVVLFAVAVVEISIDFGIRCSGKSCSPIHRLLESACKCVEWLVLECHTTKTYHMF